jgi:hypothetical protein
MPKILITDVQVIPWPASENLWGVALTFSDGHRHKYRVGTHTEAIAHIKEIRDKRSFAKTPKARRRASSGQKAGSPLMG